MTLEKARQLIWQAERVKLTVLAVYAQPNRTGDYSLVMNLNLATDIGSYGSDLFSGFEEAKAFVNEYKAKGCPLGSAFLKFRAEYHRPNSSQE